MIYIRGSLGLALSTGCISVCRESGFAFLGFAGLHAVREITAGAEIHLIRRRSVEGGMGDLAVVGSHRTRPDAEALLSYRGYLLLGRATGV